MKRGDIRFRGGLLTACLLACTVLSGCAESSQSPEVLAQRGHLMESRGRFQDAIDAYTQAIAARPNEASLYYDRGVAYGRLGRWDDSIADYTRAIERDAAFSRAYNNRATAYAVGHKFGPAIDDFTKSISLDPKSSLAYRNRGLAYHDMGKLNQAIDDYMTAIRLDPTAFEGYFERGNAYLELNQFQKALDDFDKALAIDASRGPAWLNRGEAHRRLNQLDRARADFAKAREIDPKLVPTETSPPVPPTSIAAHDSPGSTDSSARHEQALLVATQYLEAHGFAVERAGAGNPLELIARTKKDGRRIDVLVQTSADGQNSLRFSREQVDAARRAPATVGLVIVSKLAAPAGAAKPAAMGNVTHFVENWKPIEEKLVPVVFEYPLPARPQK